MSTILWTEKCKKKLRFCVNLQIFIRTSGKSRIVCDRRGWWWPLDRKWRKQKEHEGTITVALFSRSQRELQVNEKRGVSNAGRRIVNGDQEGETNSARQIGGESSLAPRET